MKIDFITIDENNKITGIWKWTDKDFKIAEIINGNWEGVFSNTNLIKIYIKYGDAIIEKDLSEENLLNYKLVLFESPQVVSSDYNIAIYELQNLFNKNKLPILEKINTTYTIEKLINLIFKNGNRFEMPINKYKLLFVILDDNTLALQVKLNKKIYHNWKIYTFEGFVTFINNSDINVES